MAQKAKRVPAAGSSPSPWLRRFTKSRKSNPMSRMPTRRDRKSTRLNSSHGYISYAVFCLKKKKNTQTDGAREHPSEPLRFALVQIDADWMHCAHWLHRRSDAYRCLAGYHQQRLLLLCAEP